jgi:ABC-type glutathione transport system ATPase component
MRNVSQNAILTVYLPRHGQGFCVKKHTQAEDKQERHHKHGSDWLRVKGARTHNLKNIDVEMPRGAVTVITGLSGSGKSSLAFDTIFAEGQRRYVESLSAYASPASRRRSRLIRRVDPTTRAPPWQR